MERRAPRRGLLVGALLTGLLLAPCAAPARATVDLGAELMHLTNLDRNALGETALAIDPTLVALAGSEPFACPSSRGMILDGRATDMAQRGYFGHGIVGCMDPSGADYTILDVLNSAFGYATYRAENIGWSTSGPSPTANYELGCDVTRTNCAGGTTEVSAAVAAVEAAFMASAEHRSTILGAYDRFGCASAQSGDRTDLVCLFSLGGPASIDRTAPTVVSASGSMASYAYGSGRIFTAVVRDNERLGSASASLDGTRLKTWRYPSGGRSSTLRLTIASARLTRGTHRLMWRLVDAAGNTGTRLVTFIVH